MCVCVSEYTLCFLYSPIDGFFGCCLGLAAVSNAAMSMEGVQMSPYPLISLSADAHVPRNWISVHPVNSYMRFRTGV